MSKNKKSRVKTESYKKVQADLATLIDRINNLYSDAKKNKDMIALWVLGFMHDDLVKCYHRLGNVKYTIKGGEINDL